MIKNILTLSCVLILLLAATATADWSSGDGHKMHWPQLPDEAGWDVNATKPMVLADDWKCSETGWIKDIHFWGSWRGDFVDEIEYFVIVIADDIPADPPNIPYSRPGKTLKEYYIYEFAAVPIDPPTEEGWYDPATEIIIPNDHGSYFQYNVFLNESEWFWQERDKIYWLNISAVLPDGSNATWGWKSSQNHWNVWRYS